MDHHAMSYAEYRVVCWPHLLLEFDRSLKKLCLRLVGSRNHLHELLLKCLLGIHAEGVLVGKRLNDLKEFL